MSMVTGCRRSQWTSQSDKVFMDPGLSRTPTKARGARTVLADRTVPEWADDHPLWHPQLRHRQEAWRQLDGATRDAVSDAASARALMLAHPSVIKRPVVAWPDGVTVGFDADAWLKRR
jgi:hypothetical protein